MPQISSRVIVNASFSNKEGSEQPYRVLTSLPIEIRAALDAQGSDLVKVDGEKKFYPTAVFNSPEQYPANSTVEVLWDTDAEMDVRQGTNGSYFTLASQGSRLVANASMKFSMAAGVHKPATTEEENPLG